MTGTSFKSEKNVVISIKKIIGWMSLIILCMSTGLLTALAPLGLLIRIIALPIGLVFLSLCWMLRHKEASLPNSGFFFLLMLTVCLSVLWPRYVYFSLGGPHANPLTLSILTSLTAIFLWTTYSPAFSTKLRKVIFNSTGIGHFILLWLGWCLFASILGEQPFASLLDYARDLVYISSFFLIGCTIATYENGPKWMLRVVVSSGLIVVSAGLIEALLHQNYFLQFASGGDSQEVADALKTIQLDKTRDGSYRAQSTFDHPIVFAQFIAAIIPLAVYFLLSETHRIWRLIGVLVVPVGALAIAESGSRSGIVSLAAAFTFIGIFIWMRSITAQGFGKVFAIAALPALLLGIAVAYFVAQELVFGRSSSETGSSSVRLRMVWDSVAALNDSPIWGFGHGMAVLKAGVTSGHTGVMTIDSLPLTIALNYGYIGLLLFIATIFIFVVKGSVAAIRLRDQEGIRAGMVVASVLALTATFAGLSINNNMTLLWLLIGTALPSIKNSAASSPKHL